MIREHSSSIITGKIESSQGKILKVEAARISKRLEVFTGCLVWIEAKSGEVAPKDSKKLESFFKYHPSADDLVIVVPEGPARILKNGVQILALSTMLERMF